MENHVIEIESAEVMGMPMTFCKCSCGQKIAFSEPSAKKAGFRSDYEQATKWKCPNEL